MHSGLLIFILVVVPLGTVACLSIPSFIIAARLALDCT